LALREGFALLPANTSIGGQVTDSSGHPFQGYGLWFGTRIGRSHNAEPTALAIPVKYLHPGIYDVTARLRL